MKLKTIKTVFLMTLVSLLSSFSFIGCSNDGKELEDPYDPYEGKTGVFKIEIEMTKTGESDVVISGSFVGSTKTAETANLYNLDGSYVGKSYVFSDVVDVPKKTITFFTSKDAVNLYGSISFVVEKENTLSYSIKGYYYNKKIKEISNTITPTETIISVSEEFDLSFN